MDIAKLVLDFVRAVLSPQVVAGVVVVVAFLLFRNQLDELLRGGFRLRSPGGYEFESQREKSGKEGLAKEPLAPVASPPENPATLNQALNTIVAFKAQAALWEYRYLNYFLVRSTQMVLDWLVSLPPVSTTVQLFDTIWLPFIPNGQERSAIIDALQAHHLIEVKGDLLEVTDKGREYLEFRGPLPSLPTPRKT